MDSLMIYCVPIPFLVQSGDEEKIWKVKSTKNDFLINDDLKQRINFIFVDNFYSMIT